MKNQKNKVMQTLRLEQETVDVLKELSENGILEDSGTKISIREVIENILDSFMYSYLEPLYIQNAMSRYMSHTELAKMFIRHRRAMRGDTDYHVSFARDPMKFEAGECRTSKELSETYQQQLAEYNKTPMKIMVVSSGPMKGEMEICDRKIIKFDQNKKENSK